ncbi:MAG: hypothetical protein AAF415_02380 [Pseudomonadota bacterium]
MPTPDFCISLPLPGDEDYPTIPAAASLPDLGPKAQEALQFAGLQANPNLIFLAIRMVQAAKAGMPEGYTDEELVTLRGAYLLQLQKELHGVTDHLVLCAIRFAMQGINHIDATTVPFHDRAKVPGAV